MLCSGEQETTATADGAATESTTAPPPDLDPGRAGADIRPRALREGSAIGRLLRSQRETNSVAAAPLTSCTGEATVAAPDAASCHGHAEVGSRERIPTRHEHTHSLGCATKCNQEHVIEGYAQEHLPRVLLHKTSGDFAAPMQADRVRQSTAREREGDEETKSATCFSVG